MDLTSLISYSNNIDIMKKLTLKRYKHKIIANSLKIAI